MKPRCHSETHFTAPRSQKTNTTTNLKDKKQLTEGKKYLKYISKLLIPLVCEQLEYLDEKIVIERITGDPEKEEVIEPKWLLKKFCVLNDIDKEMKKRDISQGDKVNHS